jgi:hypothetical protein
MSEAAKANTLQVEVLEGTTLATAVARAAFDGHSGNAMTAKAFFKGSFGELDITESVKVLKETTKRVHDGKLQDLETTLTAQASTLDAIFNELARRAALNMGEYINATETYLRLALKAQTQCRATIETLAAIKNPPVVFTRNANIVNGNQQVNHQPQANSLIGEKADSHANESLEHHHANTLDTGAQTAPARANSDLEAVEQVHRPAKRTRKG